MDITGHTDCEAFQALTAAGDDGVLAMIAGVNGPSYRPVGAAMAVLGNQQRVGSLSSGCIEKDIALHAMRVLETGRPEIVRYGEGSPYIDIQLPCGGGLEVLLVPRPDREALDRLGSNHSARIASTLVIDIESGEMSIAEDGETGRQDGKLLVRVEADIAFNIFGKGPEASTFAALARSAGYAAVLLSPDQETLDVAANAGCRARHLVSAEYPADLATDSRTAVVLFFHDHDWEPPILAAALQTPAFYIGAQGSMQARDARLQALEDLGVSAEDRARLYGPVGLIPSARDHRTLAVSVMAEVLTVDMHGAS